MVVKKEKEWGSVAGAGFDIGDAIGFVLRAWTQPGRGMRRSWHRRQDVIDGCAMRFMAQRLQSRQRKVGKPQR
jgi:hypothetical protein